MSECRNMALSALNFLAVRQNCFMGLEADAKEWSLRLMANAVDFGENKETGLLLVRKLFDAEGVSKKEVSDLIKTLPE